VRFKKLFIFKIISLLVAVVFFLENTTYAIDLPRQIYLRVPIDRNIDRLEEVIFLFKIKKILGQVVKAENDKELEFYGETRTALVLDNSKIIVKDKIYEKYISDDTKDRKEAYQIIVHEMAYQMLKVIKGEDYFRYTSIMDLALNELAELYFETGHSNRDYKDEEELANDIWA